MGKRKRKYAHGGIVSAPVSISIPDAVIIPSESYFRQHPERATTHNITINSYGDDPYAIFERIRTVLKEMGI